MSNPTWELNTEQAAIENEAVTTHEEPIGSATILLNVWVQILNLVIFFLIFKKLIWDKIAAGLTKRQELMNKLKNADQEYEDKIEKARKRRREIVDEGIIAKNKILEEAKVEAMIEKENILKQAEVEKENIISTSKDKMKQDRKNMEEEWVDSVKKTSLAIFDKVVGEKEVMEKYLDKVVIK